MTTTTVTMIPWREILTRLDDLCSSNLKSTHKTFTRNEIMISRIAKWCSHLGHQHDWRYGSLDGEMTRRTIKWNGCGGSADLLTCTIWLVFFQKEVEESPEEKVDPNDEEKEEETDYSLERESAQLFDFRKLFSDSKGRRWLWWARMMQSNSVQRSLNSRWRPNPTTTRWYPDGLKWCIKEEHTNPR